MTSRHVTAAVIMLRDAQWSSEHFDVRYIIIGLKMAKLQQFQNFGFSCLTNACIACAHARTHERTHARTITCTHASCDVAAAATMLRYTHWSSEHLDVRYVKIGLKMVKLQDAQDWPNSC